MTGPDLLRPSSIEEALDHLARYGEDAKVVAGGTALVLMMKQRLVQPSVLLSIGGIAELHTIGRVNGHVAVGAMATHRDVDRSADAAAVSLLGETYRQVATVRIRNQATVGGGLAHGDPSQDPPAAYLVLDASARVRSKAGERRIPMDSFFRDYYETAVTEGELLVAIDVPVPQPGSGAVYLKFLPRSVDDYATVGVAASLRVVDGRLRDVKVAYCAAGPIPLRARKVEAALEGQAISKAVIRDASELARREVDPLDDVRGSAEYKKDMAVVFGRRALEEAVRRAGAAV